MLIPSGKTALITISTRASLKKYHTYNLVLGRGESGDQWELQRIGTEREKMHVERELQELRERLSQVEKWKARHEEIEKELAKVWVGSGEEMGPPPYVEKEADGKGKEVESVGLVEAEAEETQDEAEYQEAREDVGAETDGETEIGDAAAGAEAEVGDDTTAAEGRTIVV